jgi:capsular exopolysaccharide synthesis family protein
VRVAEAYRTLRTHVLFSIPDVERKRLVVTSALPQEGKSTVVANLALAIARADRKVWLVDGDLRRSTLRRWFPEAGSPGLARLLAGQASVDDVVRPTTEPNLWYVDSGPTMPNSGELLGAHRMALLTEQARTRADVVLFDSPPLLPVADAEVTATQVDGVLMVVRVGETNRRALAQARRRLERVGAKIVGAVLNFVPASRRDDRYYDLYYNTHRGSEGDRDASRRDAPVSARKTGVPNDRRKPS